MIGQPKGRYFLVMKHGCRGVTFGKKWNVLVKAQGNSTLIYDLPIASAAERSMRMVSNKINNIVNFSKCVGCK